MSNSLAQSAFQIADHHFGKPFSNEIELRARHLTSLLNTLKKAAATENKRRVRGAQNRIFRSYSAKLVCLVLSFKPKHSCTVEELKAAAQAINPSRDCGERVIAWAEPKSSGNGWRPVCAFGLKRKALQRLIVEILDARYPAEEIDYLRKGRGAERASDRIVSLHDAFGVHDFIVADIKDFFRSIEIGQVSELTGLPETVVQNSLLIQQTAHLSIVGGLPPDCTRQCLNGTVREGLPQGSRASQNVASLILNPTLQKISPSQRAIVHGDDMVLGAESEKSAHALNTALREALMSHPAGPFRLKHSDVVSLSGDGFNFLQYHHRHNHILNVIQRRPSTLSHWRFRQKIAVFFTNCGDRTAVRKSARYRWHWRRSFRKWHRSPASDNLHWLGFFEAMSLGQNRRAKILNLLWSKKFS